MFLLKRKPRKAAGDGRLFVWGNGQGKQKEVKKVL